MVPVTIINIALCALVFILGFWGFRKRGDELALYIGVAFAIFGVSHVMTLTTLARPMENVLIVMRVIAYLVVVASLYREC